jgi:F0F1-type ATP synthase assembly protein I
MSEVVAERHGGETLAKGALASAVLAVLGFFILGFATGGWWFIIGLIFGAVAVILGVMARSLPRAPLVRARSSSDLPSRGRKSQ